MTSAIDWRPFFQSGAFNRVQVQILQRLFDQYSTSVDASAAPSDATYLTLSTNSTLSAERLFAAGTGINVVDAGANGAFTVSVDLGDFTTDDLAEGSTNLYFTDERAQDALGAAIALGTGDGATLDYSDVANSLGVTNTDKGSTAVTAHEAAPDPHPQYLTAAVTSVALAVPSGLGVSGSPVTGAGTLTITVDDAAVFRSAIGAGTGNGSVTSVDITPPASGITASGGPVTGSGAITLALADDLAALEALTGTDTIYYRSGASAWSAVAIGANLTFSGGTLAATGGGGGPDYNIDGGTPSTVYGGSMTIDAGGP